MCAWYYEDNLCSIYDVLTRLLKSLARFYLFSCVYTATEKVKPNMKSFIGKGPAKQYSERLVHALGGEFQSAVVNTGTVYRYGKMCWSP
jgi:hypothetical protein